MAIVMPDIGNGLIMIFNVLVITMMMRGMALMIMMLIIMPLRMTMIITTRMILFAGRPNRESAETGGGESLEAEAAAAAREALPMAASPPAPRAGQVIRRADQSGRRRAAGHGKIPLAEHLTTFLFRFGLLMSGNLFQE